MKYLSGVKFAAIAIIAALVVSCASSAGGSTNRSTQPQFHGSELTASQGESEIILNSSSNAGTLSVFVDGVLKQTMPPRDSVKIIVSDGQHQISVDWLTKDNTGTNIPFKGEALTLNAESKGYVFNISLPELLGGSSALVIGKKVELKQVSTNVLSGRNATSTSKGVEGAAIRATESLMEDLSHNANIAVLSVASNNKETAATVVDEIEFQLVKSKLFNVVNRKEIDSVRSERNLQMSGDVSDESAVSIGKTLGASIVVTGSISGSGTSQRLTLKALDVETTKIVSMVREPF